MFSWECITSQNVVKTIPSPVNASSNMKKDWSNNNMASST